MSTVTSLLNKSTSVTTDIILCTGIGCGAAVLLALLPVTLIPFLGQYIPVVGGAVTGMACYHRQRTNLRSPPAKF